MADILFAFDPALDRPIPRLEAAPAPVLEAVMTAPLAALEAAVTAARREHATLLVLFGRILDSHRASPAQAATLRSLITDLASHGCRTAWMATDRTVCDDVARMLGDPDGLFFVTPQEPMHVDVRGIDVELVVAADAPHVDDVAPPLHTALARRIVVGWDASHWNCERWDRDDEVAEGHRSAAGWSHATAVCVWGSRGRPPQTAGIHHLPALQARTAHESAAGACGLLTLLEHPPADDAVPLADRRDLHESRADWRNNWREEPTHQVAWRTLGIPSATGGDEELATAIWSALEELSLDPRAPLNIVRCNVECGTSVARRVRVAEISAETLARLRQRFDARTFRAWCNELVADPGESLTALGHTRSGAKPGSTTSFSTALADICNGLEQQQLASVPPDLAREAAWLALELIEST